MGKLITVVGNSGVGKTTLTKQLCDAAPFVPGLEQHEERPFQKQFSADLHRYSLANQVDYLLFRAEQEQLIRQSDSIGIQDGGLEEDFHVFTRRFFHQGYLSGEEYDLCERLYTLLRGLFPPPDIIIRLAAPLSVVAERYVKRGRKLEIATPQDFAELEALLNRWLSSVRSIPIITVDASTDDYCSPKEISRLLDEINGLLAPTQRVADR